MNATDDNQSLAAAGHPRKPWVAKWRRMIDEALSGPANILAIVIVAAAFAVGHCIILFGTQPAHDVASWGQFGDFLDGILNPVIGFFTVTALIVTVEQNKRLVRASHDQTEIGATERRFTVSQDALRSATAGIEAAVTQLQAAGNNRIKWISAARLLATAQRLRRAVTDPIHVDMLEIVIEPARQKVGTLLGYDNPGKGGGFFMARRSIQKAIRP